MFSSGRKFRSRHGLAVVACAGAFVVAPSGANAEITQVFTETATPINCTVQGLPDTGVRFCGSSSPRSTVPTFDGVPIDVNVAFPPEPADPADDGNFPMVMMFHGYGGGKFDLTTGMRRWVNQGYAVFSMTTRGFKESCGSLASRNASGSACQQGYLRLMDTRYEVRDAQEFASLLVDEGVVDPNAIGASGGSYGGGMSMALAALKNRIMLQDGSLTDWETPDGTPMSLTAAVPNIPWTDLAYSLAPNGGTLDYVADSPYFGHVNKVGVEKKGWVNRLYLGGLSSPGFYSNEDPDANLEGWKAVLDSGGPYGQDARDIIDEITAHHSSYYIDDSVEPAPMLISNGFTDDLFPADEAVRYYNRTLTNYPDADIAMSFGDFGHPRGQNLSATTNFIGARENAWMNYYLKGQGTEPAKNVQALTQTCGGPPAGPYTGATYADLAPGEITFTEAAAKTIDADGQVLFGMDFQGDVPPPFPNSCKTVPSSDSPAAAVYKLPAAPTGGYTMLGSPTVLAQYSSSGTNDQVAARLMDIAPDNTQKLIARGLWRPDESNTTSQQVFQLHANGWKVEEGHILKLELLPHDDPYSVVATGQTDISVSNLEMRLPVVESPGALDGLVEAPAAKVLPGQTQLAPGFDSGAPTTRLLSTPQELTNDSTPTFEFTSSDTNSTYKCSIDGGTPFNCSSPYTVPVALSDGEHTFTVVATDSDGNADPIGVSYTFTVDTTPPNTKAKAKKQGKRYKVTFSSNEDNVTFECKEKGGDFEACVSPVTLKAGKKLQVRAIDAVGNVDPTPAKVKAKKKKKNRN